MYAAAIGKPHILSNMENLGKGKKLEIHQRVEQNKKGIHENDPKRNLRHTVDWSGMISFTKFLIDFWKNYNLINMRKNRLRRKKGHRTNRYGQGSSKICSEIETRKWFFQKRTNHFENRGHLKVGAAKISKPNFQRLFLATKKKNKRGTLTKNNNSQKVFN